MNATTRRFPDVGAMLAVLQPSYPVYCVHPDRIRVAARRFTERFAGRVLYAVKCNPHPLVLRALWDGGIRHFDTASLPEIAQVCEQLDQSVAYFMHPVKAREAIRTAFRVYQVDTFVVDHPDELTKVIDEVGSQGISVVVRIATPQAVGTLYHLADKFGAPEEEAAELLRAAAAKGCGTGIAFHVGSQCARPRAYIEALEVVGEVLEAAGTRIGLLDVGGGFPAAYPDRQVPPIEDFLVAIESGTRALRLDPDCVLMCEPGRALVADGCSLVIQVQLRKGDRLYVNDGLHGSLSEVETAGIRFPVRLHRRGGAPVATATRRFVLNGPTCDSLDVLPLEFELPEDAGEGDWIEVSQCGAYSNALATSFNGFHPETFVEIEEGEG
ncbi:MAG: type III PLP-dependent enzyme [Kiloniellales bacterium]